MQEASKHLRQFLQKRLENPSFFKGKYHLGKVCNQFRLSMKFICQEDSFNNILNGFIMTQGAVDGVFNQGFASLKYRTTKAT